VKVTAYARGNDWFRRAADSITAELRNRGIDKSEVTVVTCDTEPAPRRAPVQADSGWHLRHVRKEFADRHPSGTVLWTEHEEAWRGYAKKFPSSASQTAERVAERGGFGYEEMTGYLGHAPTTWEPTWEPR
jgi:hypothetical protein